MKTLFALLALISCCFPAYAAPAATPLGLAQAYPDLLAAVEDGTLLWRDGTRMALDGEPGAADSIRAMFSVPYPAGAPLSVPQPGEDPGRIRYEPFFVKMYGDCRNGRLPARRVTWVDGKRPYVSSVNGVNEKLEAVVEELKKLPPEMRKYLTPLGGVYTCRTVRGDDSLSMHAYAAAIDINTAYGDYWKNYSDEKSIHYRNRIPKEIVDAFERHGFIWGGRWYHYDTGHFEYRPELFPLKAP